MIAKLRPLTFLLPVFFWSTPGPAYSGNNGTIAQVLKCGSPGTAGGLAAGMELQRYDLDLTRFPLAVCNDGTPAVMYFRPYSGAANRNRWLIQLQGGGLCSTPDSCAMRWCAEGTNFGNKKMSSTWAPVPGIPGKGITDRRADNPWGSWNQVFVYYCSSDAWSGQAVNLLVTAADPVTAVPKTFQIQFLGSRIVDAVLDTLRRQGGQPLLYTMAGANQQLPNLDEAEQVVLAGASAGSSGVINNIDRFANTLRQFNTNCRGNQGCALDIRALIDSGFSPSYEGLDFTTSTYCISSGLCTYQAFMQNEDQNGGSALWRQQGDESCLAWHRLNMPGTDWQCSDLTHDVRHHITTPLFVRMGQQDMNVSRDYIQAGLTVPGQGLINLESFAQLVRDQLTGLANIQSTAHEGGNISVIPGAFGPTCTKHETLRSNPDIFDVNIPFGGGPYTMFNVVLNWISGMAPSILVTNPPATDVCPTSDPDQ